MFVEGEFTPGTSATNIEIQGFDYFGTLAKTTTANSLAKIQPSRRVMYVSLGWHDIARLSPFQGFD